jgi:hypothetical protein
LDQLLEKARGELIPVAVFDEVNTLLLPSLQLVDCPVHGRRVFLFAGYLGFFHSFLHELLPFSAEETVGLAIDTKA